MPSLCLRILFILFGIVRAVDSLESAASKVSSEMIYPSQAEARNHSRLDASSYVNAPPELELKQVHVYVRHGERTPVSVRMNEPPASIPAHWMMCKTAERFRASVSSFCVSKNKGDLSFKAEEDFLPVSKSVERADGTSVAGECLLGELTDVGKESTLSYGRALRELYIEKLGFLPDTLGDNADAYFRSTNMPRTMESLQQVIHGLYPPSKLASGVVPRMFIRNGVDENLVANGFVCKRLEVLLVGFAQAAAAAFNPILEPLDQKISKYINGNPIRLDGKPRASGVLDTIRASTAHGVTIPSEFNEKNVMDLIEKAVTTEWFSDETDEVRRLGMGRLLEELSRKMADKAEHGAQDPLKILVHSTHDTGIAPLLSTFDVYDDKWPPFTAAVSFELFRRKEASSQGSYFQTLLGALSPFSGNARSPEHFVRIRYQNKDLVLPMCADKGKHLPGAPEFCTLAAFQSRVRELTPKNWEAECSVSSKQHRT